MRRRERAYALVLGTICTLGLLAGAWPLPLLAFALLELSYTTVEHAPSIRARGLRRTLLTVARSRQHPAGGILRGTP